MALKQTITNKKKNEIKHDIKILNEVVNKNNLTQNGASLKIISNRLNVDWNQYV